MEVELVFADVVEVVFIVEEVVLTVVELEVAFVEEVDLIEVELLVEVQFPEAGWHPAPQYLIVQLVLPYNGEIRGSKRCFVKSLLSICVETRLEASSRGD